MATSDVFEGLEDQILVVKNDASEYYVPSFGVTTLDQMCPGEGYAIFLSGDEGIDFTYPSGMLGLIHPSDELDDYKACSRRDDVAVTGESHIIILSDISGEVREGDILRAYADDELVGSINICEEHLSGERVVDLVAHESLDFTQWGGDVLPGYNIEDAIEIKLYSQDRGMELAVDAGLDVNEYGLNAKMSTGTIHVTSGAANPTSFRLSQNYPNPFNPSTVIEYNVESSGLVSLKVYDIMGRLVRTLVDNQHRDSGNADYSVIWNGLDNSGQQVSAGLYLYRLESGAMSTANKMILLK